MKGHALIRLTQKGKEVEFVLSTCEALDWIPSTKRKKKTQNIRMQLLILQTHSLFVIALPDSPSLFSYFWIPFFPLRDLKATL
jgi:hypothetical protein